jgi:hypothetical protein
MADDGEPSFDFWVYVRCVALMVQQQWQREQQAAAAESSSSSSSGSDFGMKAECEACV